MVLEAKMAKIEARLAELDRKIDACSSELELNQIGDDIRRFEEQLAPLKRAAELDARLEESLIDVKKRVARRGLRL
jgi:hypothetical protein